MRIVCPLCKRIVEGAPEDFPPRPFCSPRCKLVDLGNWLGGSYRISSPLESDDDGSDRTDDGDHPSLERRN